MPTHIVLLLFPTSQHPHLPAYHGARFTRPYFRNEQKLHHLTPPPNPCCASNLPSSISSPDQKPPLLQSDRREQGGRTCGPSKPCSQIAKSRSGHGSRTPRPSALTRRIRPQIASQRLLQALTWAPEGTDGQGKEKRQGIRCHTGTTATRRHAGCMEARTQMKPGTQMPDACVSAKPRCDIDPCRVASERPAR